MIRAGKLSNKFQKRLIRPLYGQTQAYPYAATLDASLRDATTNDIVLPIVAGSTNPLRTGAAATLKSGLHPGLVMVKSGAGETAKVAASNTAFQAAGGINAATRSEQPFGLLANFVGGQLDELGDENQIGIWRGPDGVFELLAPAFDPAIATAYALKLVAGDQVPLYAGTDGRLTSSTANNGATTPAVIVAYLIECVGTSRITIDLRV